MAAITRTYTFVDGTTAYGSQVEIEISNIVTAWNNHNAGSSQWTALSVLGNGSIGGTLGVTGATTLSSTLGISGATTFSALTASTVPYLDASKVLTSSAVTPTELGYVSGVTSALQTQLGLLAPKASPTFSGSITTPLTASRVVKTTAGSVLTTGTVDLSNTNEVTGSVGLANGGTGLTTRIFIKGSYTGNGATQNIAHGLGATPDFIIIADNTTAANIPEIWISGMGASSHDFNGVRQTNAVTGVDGTNIALGANNAVNQNTVTYSFVAFKSQ